MNDVILSTVKMQLKSNHGEPSARVSLPLILLYN